MDAKTCIFGEPLDLTTASDSVASASAAGSRERGMTQSILEYLYLDAPSTDSSLPRVLFPPKRG
jgi:hypothetical protein